MELHCGTSGYSYKEWKGAFYPADLPARDMLRYYGEHLDAVEINNTFYALPKAKVLEGWAGQVPDAFRFSIKASRRITHFKRLHDAGEELGYLLETVRVLGTRLGVLLFQLPPNLKQDVARLDAFVGQLPPAVPSAFEFRHPSWNDGETHAVLRASGCAWVTADVDDAEPPALVPTCDWGYVRLRRTDYDDAQLDAWARRLRASGWRRAFVFFKHEDEAAGPRLAARFTELFAARGGG